MKRGSDLDSTDFEIVDLLVNDGRLSNRALAGAVGLIAWRDWMAGRAQDPAAVDANYVRRSDAELLWKDER